MPCHAGSKIISRLKVLIILCFTSGVYLSGCGTDTTSPPDHSPRLSALDVVGTRVNQGHYPLGTGWKWKYLRTFTVFTLDGEVDYQSHDTSSVEVMGLVEVGEVMASVLSIHTVTDQGQSYEGTIFYAQDREALVQLDATGSVPFVYPSPRVGEGDFAGFQFRGWSFNSAEELDDFFRAKGPLGAGFSSPSKMAIREEPRIVLDYPLRPRKSWIAFSNPWVQTRTAVGRERVTVPAGRWAATRIDIDLGISSETSFSDWFGPPGLIRRRIEVLIAGGTVFQTDTSLVVETTELLSYTRGHPALDP